MKNVGTQDNYNSQGSTNHTQKFVSVAFVSVKMDSSKTLNGIPESPTDVTALRNQFQQIAKRSSISDLDPKANYLDPSSLPQQTRRRLSQENWTATNLIGVQPVDLNPMFHAELKARVDKNHGKSVEIENGPEVSVSKREVVEALDTAHGLIERSDVNESNIENPATVVMDPTDQTSNFHRQSNIPLYEKSNQRDPPSSTKSTANSTSNIAASDEVEIKVPKAKVFGVPMEVDLTGTIQSCTSTLSVSDQNADGYMSTQGFSPLNSLTADKPAPIPEHVQDLPNQALNQTSPVKRKPIQKQSTGINFTDFSESNRRMPSPELSPVPDEGNEQPKLSITIPVSKPARSKSKPMTRSQSFRSPATGQGNGGAAKQMVTNTVNFQPKRNKAEVNVHVLPGNEQRLIDSRSPANNHNQRMQRSSAFDDLKDKTIPPVSFVETNQRPTSFQPSTPRGNHDSMQRPNPISNDRISIPSTESDLSSNMSSSQEEGITGRQAFSDRPVAQSRFQDVMTQSGSPVPPLNLPLSARTVQTHHESIPPLNLPESVRSDHRGDQLQMEVALLRSQLQSERDLAFALQNEIRLKETIKHMPERDQSVPDKPVDQNTNHSVSFETPTDTQQKDSEHSSEEVPTKDSPIKPEPKRLTDQLTQTQVEATVPLRMQSTPSPVQDVIPDRYYRKLSNSTIGSKADQNSNNETVQDAMANIERAHELDRLKSSLERANRKNKKLQELVNRQALLMTSIKEGKVQPDDPVTPRTNGYRKQTSSLLEQLDELNQEMDVLEQEIYSKDRQIEQLTRELGVKQRLCIKQEENIRLKDECMRKLTLEAKTTATQFRATINETKKLKEGINLIQLRLKEQEELNTRLRVELNTRDADPFNDVKVTDPRKSKSHEVTKLQEENRQLRLKLVKATENNNRLRQYLEQNLMSTSKESFTTPERIPARKNARKSRDKSDDRDKVTQSNGYHGVTFSRGLNEKLNRKSKRPDTFADDLSWEHSPTSKLVDENMRVLYAIAEVEDYELLKTTFTQACLLMDEMEARVRERLHLHQFASHTESLDYDTWREMGRSLDEIHSLNNDARGLIFRFWLSHLPDTSSSNDFRDADIMEQNKVLTEQLAKYKKEHSRVKQKLIEANTKLKKTARLRDDLQQDMTRSTPKRMVIGGNETVTT